MRIGIDIRTLMDTQYSGVAEYVLNLLHALFKINQHHQYYLFYNSVRNRSATIPKFEYPNVQLVERRYPNKILNYGLFKFLNWPKVDQLLNQKVDLFLMPHLNFIALSRQGKNILTVHDLSFLRYPKFFYWRKNFWHAMINVRGLVKKFNSIVAISENTKQDLINLCHVPAEKISVIPSAIDSKYQRLAMDSQELARVKSKLNLPDKFILHLGTIEPRKNIEGLVAAYDHFRDQNSDQADVKLVIAGGQGWKCEQIYKAIQDSKYTNDIILTGYVENQDKVALYNLAEVFAFPSFYEGFGFPPLEAMACGTPVICSFASSLPEVVGSAAILVDPYNSTQISQALNMLISDKNLQNSLISKGIARAGQYSWQRTAREYLNLFK